MNEMLMLLNKQISINKGLIMHFEICRNNLLNIQEEERDLYYFEKKDIEFYNNSINDLSNEINIYLSIISFLRCKNEC